MQDQPSLSSLWKTVNTFSVWLVAPRIGIAWSVDASWIGSVASFPLPHQSWETPLALIMVSFTIGDSTNGENRFLRRVNSALLSLGWRMEIKFHDHAHTSFVPALTRRLVEHHGVCAATGAPASNSLHSTFFRRSDPPSRPNKNLKTQKWIHEHQFLLRRVLLVFHRLLLPFSLFCATCSQSSRLDVAIAVFL